MKAALCVLSLAFAMVTVSLAADDKKEEKEVTLKGTITCAKCDLKKEKACAVVLVTKDKDNKEVVYYFDAKGHAANHTKGANVCQQAKKGSVTGTVSEKGDKKIITVKKVELDKE